MLGDQSYEVAESTTNVLLIETLKENLNLKLKNNIL